MAIPLTTRLRQEKEERRRAYQGRKKEKFKGVELKLEDEKIKEQQTLVPTTSKQMETSQNWKLELKSGSGKITPSNYNEKTSTIRSENHHPLECSTEVEKPRTVLNPRSAGEKSERDWKETGIIPKRNAPISSQSSIIREDSTRFLADSSRSRSEKRPWCGRIGAWNGEKMEEERKTEKPRSRGQSKEKEKNSGMLSKARAKKLARKQRNKERKRDQQENVERVRERGEKEQEDQGERGVEKKGRRPVRDEEFGQQDKNISLDSILEEMEEEEVRGAAGVDPEEKEEESGEGSETASRQDPIIPKIQAFTQAAQQILKMKTLVAELTLQRQILGRLTRKLNRAPDDEEEQVALKCAPPLSFHAKALEEYLQDHQGNMPIWKELADWCGQNPKYALDHFRDPSGIETFIGSRFYGTAAAWAEAKKQFPDEDAWNEIYCVTQCTWLWDQNKKYPELKDGVGDPVRCGIGRRLSEEEVLQLRPYKWVEQTLSDSSVDSTLGQDLPSLMISSDSIKYPSEGQRTKKEGRLDRGCDLFFTHHAMSGTEVTHLIFSQCDTEEQVQLAMEDATKFGMGCDHMLINDPTAGKRGDPEYQKRIHPVSWDAEMAGYKLTASLETAKNAEIRKNKWEKVAELRLKLDTLNEKMPHLTGKEAQEARKFVAENPRPAIPRAVYTEELFAQVPKKARDEKPDYKLWALDRGTEREYSTGHLQEKVKKLSKNQRKKLRTTGQAYQYAPYGFLQPPLQANIGIVPYSIYEEGNLVATMQLATATGASVVLDLAKIGKNRTLKNDYKNYVTEFRKVADPHDEEREVFIPAGNPEHSRLPEGLLNFLQDPFNTVIGHDIREGSTDEDSMKRTFGLAIKHPSEVKRDNTSEQELPMLDGQKILGRSESLMRAMGVQDTARAGVQNAFTFSAAGGLGRGTMIGRRLVYLMATTPGQIPRRKVLEQFKGSVDSKTLDVFYKIGALMNQEQTAILKWMNDEENSQLTTVQKRSQRKIIGSSVNRMRENMIKEVESIGLNPSTQPRIKNCYPTKTPIPISPKAAYDQTIQFGTALMQFMVDNTDMNKIRDMQDFKQLGQPDEGRGFEWETAGSLEILYSAWLEGIKILQTNPQTHRFYKNAPERRNSLQLFVDGVKNKFSRIGIHLNPTLPTAAVTEIRARTAHFHEYAARDPFAQNFIVSYAAMYLKLDPSGPSRRWDWEQELLLQLHEFYKSPILLGPDAENLLKYKDRFQPSIEEMLNQMETAIRQGILAGTGEAHQREELACLSLFDEVPFATFEDWLLKVDQLLPAAIPGPYHDFEKVALREQVVKWGYKAWLKWTQTAQITLCAPPPELRLQEEKLEGLSQEEREDLRTKHAEYLDVLQEEASKVAAFAEREILSGNVPTTTRIVLNEKGTEQMEVTARVQVFGVDPALLRPASRQTESAATPTSPPITTTPTEEPSKNNEVWESKLRRIQVAQERGMNLSTALSKEQNEEIAQVHLDTWDSVDSLELGFQHHGKRPFHSEFMKDSDQEDRNFHQLHFQQFHMIYKDGKSTVQDYDPWVHFALDQPQQFQKYIDYMMRRLRIKTNQKFSKEQLAQAYKQPPDTSDAQWERNCMELRCTRPGAWVAAKLEKAAALAKEYGYPVPPNWISARRAKYLPLHLKKTVAPKLTEKQIEAEVRRSLETLQKPTHPASTRTLPYIQYIGLGTTRETLIRWALASQMTNKEKSHNTRNDHWQFSVLHGTWLYCTPGAEVVAILPREGNRAACPAFQFHEVAEYIRYSPEVDQGNPELEQTVTNQSPARHQSGPGRAWSTKKARGMAGGEEEHGTPGSRQRATLTSRTWKFSISKGRYIEEPRRAPRSGPGQEGGGAQKMRAERRKRDSSSKRVKVGDESGASSRYTRDSGVSRNSTPRFH